MKIFDFNIHLPIYNQNDVNSVIQQDMNLDIHGIQNGILLHKEKLSNCTGINILLFNDKLFNDINIELFNKIRCQFDLVKFTTLIDFRSKEVFNYIDKLVECKIDAIIFNSYLQKISNVDFPKILTICKYAEEKKIIICIDGSYGTSKMFEYENLKLAAYISDNITKTPIVIVHGGSCNVIKAMLLALDKKNVWLDTSFSLPYYIDSSIEIDFAFALKKMKAEKIVYGSDHPYIDLDKSLSTHYDFFKKYKFNENEVEKIMYLNSIDLFSVQ